jgi:L-fuconolactonase
MILPPRKSRTVQTRRKKPEFGNANLVYDLLILEHQFPAVIALVDRHSNLRFILITWESRASTSTNWSRGRLKSENSPDGPTCGARYPAESPRRRSTGHRSAWRPISMLFSMHSARRLVFGSNWPISEAAGGYGKWIRAVREWAGKLSAGEWDAVLGKNAFDVYAAA